MTEFPGTPFGEPDGSPGSPQGAWPNPHPPAAYAPPPQPYPGFMPPPTRRGNGLGTASLVLGLVAVLTTLTLFGGAILGIAAVVMGIAARRRVKRGEATNGGVAMAGIVFGIIAVVLSGFVIWLGFGTELFNEDYQHCLGEQNGHEEFCDQYR